MKTKYVQNLRYKLQKRISRLNAVDTEASFLMTLSQFFRFLENQNTFSGVIGELLTRFPESDNDAERIFKGEALYGDTEEEAAALGFCVLSFLEKRKEKHHTLFNLGRSYNRYTNDNPAQEAVIELHLQPFYEYMDEQLDDRRVMLAQLKRYKHRSEWFNREKLREKSQSVERNAEKLLALDLYSYLYEQGIDFNIETESIRGKIDLIGAQSSNDPLLLDTKIFDNKSRGKSYIRKAFNQIYTYTQHFNEAFGYLVIFNSSPVELRFSLKEVGDIPILVHNNKTIFFITVDIYRHEEPVSARKPLKVIEISEKEFIEILEDEHADEK